MAMGRRKRDRQEPLWVATEDVRRQGHVLYDKLNEVLETPTASTTTSRASARGSTPR
jgi:hypothetical protein